MSDNLRPILRTHITKREPAPSSCPSDPTWVSSSHIAREHAINLSLKSFKNKYGLKDGSGYKCGDLGKSGWKGLTTKFPDFHKPYAELEEIKY